jgi:DNA-binding transcriptional ArsR family regulator
MPSRTSVPPQPIRALSHPVRLRIFGALDRRALTLTQLVQEIGEDRRCTLRHLRHLEKAGIVFSAAGPAGRVYEATTIPCFSDDHYSALPVAIRRAAVAVCLAQFQAVAVSGLESGGFDRDDVHISRTTLTVDPRDWQRVADELAEALERVDAVREDAAARIVPDDAVQATAVIMLFESGSGDPAQAGRTATFSREEALLRAWGLNENLADLLLPDGATDWNAIIAHADQLRVLASAALGAEEAREAAAVPGPHGARPSHTECPVTRERITAAPST